MGKDLKSTRVPLFFGVAAAGLSCSAAAFAQARPTEQATDANAATTGLQDIIVTAQKREQRLQSVPIAVTALTSKALEANRVVNVTDLSGLAPGFTARQTTGGIGVASFTMRGVTSFGVAPGSDKEIPIYLDGVYFGAPRGAIFDLPDIERVEVLRGPQGTLFGRNATAGAISIVTRDPVGKLALRQDFTIGNYNQFRTRTTVDTPQFGPFSAYLSFVHDERRGDTRNTGAGTVWDRTGPGTGMGIQVSPRYLGDKDENNFFGVLKFQASSDFSATYKYDRSVNHFTPGAEIPIAYNPGGSAFLFLGSLGPQLAPLYSAYFDAIVAGNSVDFASDGKRISSANNSFTTPGIQRNSGHNLTARWRLNSSLSIKNVAAYRKTYVASNQTIDGLGGLIVPQSAVLPFARFVAASSTPGFFSFPTATQAAIAAAYAANPAIQAASQVGGRLVDFAVSNTGRSEQWSDEIQVNYESRLLSITAGGIYYHQKDASGSIPQLKGTSTFSVYPASGLLPLGNQQIYYPQLTSVAAYIQAEFHVTPQLDIVGGARITHDHRYGYAELGGTFTPSATNPADRTKGTFGGTTIIPFDYKNSKPSFSATVNFHPNDDLMAYAKYSTGFLSGGTVLDFAFKPETVKSLEAGLKAQFLDRKLRTNIAVWKADYNDFQSAQGGPAVGRPDISVVVADIGKLKAYGVESEVTVAPFRGVTGGGSLSYTHAKYPNPPAYLLASSGGAYLPGNLPKWTATIYGEYVTRPISDQAYLDLRVDTNWRSSMLLDNNPNIGLQIPAFATSAKSDATWLVNGRISMRNIAGHMDLALWGRNLTNDRSAVFSSALPFVSKAASFELARTYGVDVSLRF